MIAKRSRSLGIFPRRQIENNEASKLAITRRIRGNTLHVRYTETDKFKPDVDPV